MLLDEIALLKQISLGDASALAALYDGYAPRVFGLILQIVKNQSDAEDVVQETFLQVWQQAGRFNPEKAKPEVWILLLARSRAIDRLRKKQSAPLAPQSDLPERPMNTPSSSERVVQQETRQEVCTALCTLSREQQEPIRLAFYEGMTHVEIAQQLKLPLGTIKTRIRNGMLQLRHTLAAGGEGLS